MATINFLNTVNFNGNETQNQVIHNLAANPTAPNSELGQIYYNTASNELRVCTNDATPTWTAVGSGVSSFSNTFGTFITGTTNTNATGAVSLGTLNLSATGTPSATTFLAGNNTWATPDYYTNADVDAHLNTSTATIGQILSWTGSDYDWIAQNTGDITAVNTAIGSGLSGGTAAGAANLQVVVDNVTIEIATNTIKAKTAVVINGGTALATGDQIHDFVIAQGYGTMSSFTVDGNSGTTQPITNGNTLSIDGDGTYINTVVGATDTVIINHATISQSNTTSTASPGYGASFDVIDTVSRNGAGHVTGVNVKTVTIPSAYSFSAAGDTGTAQPITNGNTLTIAGSTGIDTEASATDTIIVNLDLAELTTATTIAPATDYLVGVGGTANEKILYQNVHLNQWGAAEGNVSLGLNKIINLADGSNANDAVNYGQLQAAVGGVGLFQGGYNATTNVPVITGASNIALNQGDFYVVTIGGSFYTDTVEPGDLIFANADITANSSPASTAYTVVIADENIAGSGTTDGNTVKGVAGFDSANFAVSANGWVQIKAGGVILGTETTGTYVTSVVENTANNNRLGIAVVTSGAGDAKTETVGLNVVGLDDILTNTADADSLPIYDASVSTNKRVTATNLATYVKSKIENRDAYIILNSANSGISSTNNASDTISWTLDLTALEAAGVIDIGANVFATKIEVIDLTTTFGVGLTLYPSVIRAASTGNITLEFVKKTWTTAGLPAQGSFAALVTYVGAY